MTTENEQAQPEQQQEATTETQESQQSLAELEAELANLRAEKERLENNLKSERGQRNRELSLENSLKEVKLELDVGNRERTALINALATGDTSGLDEKLQSIRTEASSQMTMTALAQQAQSIRNDLQESLAGDDGNPVLDLNTAPELAGVRQEWDSILQGVDAGQVSPSMAAMRLSRLTGEAHRVARQKEKELLQNQIKQERENTQRARKEAVEDSGVLDNTTGDGKPSAPPTIEEVMSTNLKGRGVTSLAEEKQRILDELAKNPGIGRA